MSEESTTPDLEETLRRLREALKSGDLDAAVAVYAPDAVWDVSLLGLEGVFEGREAIRRAYEDLIAPYEDLEVVAEEFRDLGNGVTLVVLLVRGRLRGSTRFVESRLSASVATWANGLIERQTAYLDIDPGPRSRRTARPGAGVGGVAGERRVGTRGVRHGSAGTWRPSSRSMTRTSSGTRPTTRQVM
jgi:ketosteroid isomerase-like protein